MSEPLQKIEFDPSLVTNDQVASFDCGSQVWESEVSDWLKLPSGQQGAIDAIQLPGTKVWLYLTSSGKLIGYACLGPGQLKWPNPKKAPAIGSTTIPMIGVAKTSQGQGFGKQILSDLLDIAKEYIATQQIVVLSVHTDNPAIHLYTKRNFKSFGTPRPQPPYGHLYQRYVLDLLGRKIA